MKKIILIAVAVLSSLSANLFAADESTCNSCSCGCDVRLEKHFEQEPVCVEPVEKEVAPERHKDVVYQTDPEGCESKTVTVSYACPVGTKTIESQQEPKVSATSACSCGDTVTTIEEPKPICIEQTERNVTPEKHRDISIEDDEQNPGCKKKVVNISYACPAGSNEV
jgi:hypothetical protein